jgi:crotonobetainyl-CoA:carnitine CoA-transferase CaiB-like acyl-CoA transferase
MRREGIAASVVQNGQDLLEGDPQTRFRKTFLKLEHPEMGHCIVQQAPARFSAASTDLNRSPCLGEHTEYVCTKILGMSDEAFVGLSEKGVFG